MSTTSGKRKRPRSRPAPEDSEAPRPRRGAHKVSAEQNQAAAELEQDRSLGAGAVTDGSDRLAADLERRKKISFTANPVQRQFILSRAKADLFAARMGEGKSAALCWASFHHARQNPGARHAFVRDTWENLRATTLVEWFEWFPDGQVGTFERGTKTFHWNVGEMKGAKVYWLGLNSPDDAQKLQSRPLGGLFYDEPAPAAATGGISQFVFQVGVTRLRQRGIHWYANKLATNNPDERHWLYKAFVDPGTPGYVCHQTNEPENLKNLPPDYYEEISRQWEDRPDLRARFVDGKFARQIHGSQVTPEWSDALHLATGLTPILDHDKYPLLLSWDFGHNPTCTIAQQTPSGHLFVFETHVGEGIGVEELIESVVLPRLELAYGGIRIEHTGDPAGQVGEQTSIDRSPVSTIRAVLGGRWTPGPQGIAERVDPLRALLRRQVNGRGLLQVDRVKAKATYFALSGGWHRAITRTGVIHDAPAKDIHSHPGDVMGYLAARYYPMAKQHRSRRPDAGSGISTGAGSRGTRYWSARNAQTVQRFLPADVRRAIARQNGQLEGGPPR